jgi:hypothetical protein
VLKIIIYILPAQEARLFDGGQGIKSGRVDAVADQDVSLLIIIRYLGSISPLLIIQGRKVKPGSHHTRHIA